MRLLEDAAEAANLVGTPLERPDDGAAMGRLSVASDSAPKAKKVSGARHMGSGNRHVVGVCDDADGVCGGRSPKEPKLRQVPVLPSNLSSGQGGMACRSVSYCDCLSPPLHPRRAMNEGSPQEAEAYDEGTVRLALQEDGR